jgi:hypothetical protein
MGAALRPQRLEEGNALLAKLLHRAPIGIHLVLHKAGDGSRL